MDQDPSTPASIIKHGLELPRKSPSNGPSPASGLVPCRFDVSDPTWSSVYLFGPIGSCFGVFIPRIHNQDNWVLFVADKDGSHSIEVRASLKQAADDLYALQHWCITEGTREASHRYLCFLLWLEGFLFFLLWHGIPPFLHPNLVKELYHHHKISFQAPPGTSAAEAEKLCAKHLMDSRRAHQPAYPGINPPNIGVAILPLMWDDPRADKSTDLTNQVGYMSKSRVLVFAPRGATAPQSPVATVPPSTFLPPPARIPGTVEASASPDRKRAAQSAPPEAPPTKRQRAVPRPELFLPKSAPPPDPPLPYVYPSLPPDVRPQPAIIVSIPEGEPVASGRESLSQAQKKRTSSVSPQKRTPSTQNRIPSVTPQNPIPSIIPQNRTPPPTPQQQPPPEFTSPKLTIRVPSHPKAADASLPTHPPKRKKPLPTAPLQAPRIFGAGIGMTFAETVPVPAPVTSLSSTSTSISASTPVRTSARIQAAAKDAHARRPFGPATLPDDAAALRAFFRPQAHERRYVRYVRRVLRVVAEGLRADLHSRAGEREEDNTQLANNGKGKEAASKTERRPLSTSLGLVFDRAGADSKKPARAVGEETLQADADVMLAYFRARAARHAEAEDRGAKASAIGGGKESLTIADDGAKELKETSARKERENENENDYRYICYLRVVLDEVAEGLAGS
ncbi:hypothetical protein C8R43DRAFT_1006308 [Mycena crocata]|nr:hypothetical protein C8R43DRAFT_1006308 [Mycena crocata]